MVITNSEIVQASIELIGSFVSTMLAAIIIINRHKENSMRLIVKMLFISAALFIFDAFAYIFRGNTDLFSLFMTRLSNFLVFFLNFYLAYAAIRYIYSVLQENHVLPGKIYQKIVWIGFWAALAILAVNLFTGWMYSFDDSNHYHRNWGWYIYTGLSLVCLSSSCLLIFRFRKALDRFTRFSLLLFELFPIAATLLQSLYYGISITNIGIGVSIVLILVSYLFNRNRSGSNEKYSSAQLRRSNSVTILFIIMIVSISAAIVSSIISLRRISSEIAVSNSQVIARIADDYVENTFLRPMTVTETMSKDYNLQEYMRRSNEGDETVEAPMASYLESILSGFGYQMVYAVCEQSRSYYTYNGFIKTVDPAHDPSDAWYHEFVSSGRRFALKLDTDEANSWDLSVFVNNTVLDENGNLLGVCGVGLEMSELQQQLAEFEEKYKIRITLVDKEGTGWIDSQNARIGERYFSDEFLENVNTEEFYLEKLDDSIRLTTLMENLDWYLIAEDLSPKRGNIFNVLVPNLVIFLAGIFFLAVTFCVITIRERNLSGELLEKQKTTLSDELTGLKNRRALQEDCKQIEQSDSLGRKTIIMMDLNGLKTTNDTFGHQAGDELIIGTAQCLTQAMQDYGQVYRTGGDEFVVIMECSKNELGQILAAFDRLTSAWKGKGGSSISIARGVVICADYPHLNFAAMIDMADRRMYEDKKHYYISTGKKRRK